jgi:2-deoxy-D-gluconate 3-dehydrogenase
MAVVDIKSTLILQRDLCASIILNESESSQIYTAQMSSGNDYISSLFGLQGKMALVTGGKLRASSPNHITLRAEPNPSCLLYLGTRGIGQTMVLALAQAGADIILVQRATSTPNYETRDKVAALGRKVHIVECDLADKAQVKGLCKKVTGSEGEGGMGLVVDIVVNCGGIQRRTPAENFPDEDWEEVSVFRFLYPLVFVILICHYFDATQVLQVNLSTVFTISRDFGKHMLTTRGGVSGEEVPPQASSADYGGRGRGKIINVASLVSYQGQ